MVKTDCSANTWVSNYLCENMEWVINCTADCEEDFDIDDLNLSAATKNGWKHYPVEVKTIKGGYKYQNNTWFLDGIRKKSKFEEKVEDDVKMYILNQKKYNKLIEAHAILIYLFPDGMLLFSPKSLKKAFVCFGEFLNKSHTEEFGEPFNPHYETKAYLNLDEGWFVPCDPPIELFQK